MTLVQSASEVRRVVQSERHAPSLPALYVGNFRATGTLYIGDGPRTLRGGRSPAYGRWWTLCPGGRNRTRHTGTEWKRSWKLNVRASRE